MHFLESGCLASSKNDGKLGKKLVLMRSPLMTQARQSQNSSLIPCLCTCSPGLLACKGIN